MSEKMPKTLSKLLKQHAQDQCASISWTMCTCPIACEIRKKYTEAREHNDFWDHW